MGRVRTRRGLPNPIIEPPAYEWLPRWSIPRDTTLKILFLKATDETVTSIPCLQGVGHCPKVTWQLPSATTS